TGHETRTLVSKLDHAFHLSLSPDSRFLAATHSGGFKLWDVTTGQERASLEKGNWSWESELRFSPDSRLLAVRTEPRWIWLLDTATGERLTTFDGEIRVLAFAPDSQSVAFADMNCTEGVCLCLWELKTKRRIQLLGRRYPVNS